VLQDHLAGVQRQGETDLALLTDGLSAEREQGITIDVAYRYFATEERKFIIGDAPGHEQYTRNMVTAASQRRRRRGAGRCHQARLANPATGAAAANPPPQPAGAPAARALAGVCREQARRRGRPALAFHPHQRRAGPVCPGGGHPGAAIVPVSALKGWNVVDAHSPAGAATKARACCRSWSGCPTRRPTPPAAGLPGAVGRKVLVLERHRQGRRVFWGRVATGSVRVGSAGAGLPQRPDRHVAQVLDHARRPSDRAGRPQRRHRAGPRGGRLARRLAAGRPRPGRRRRRLSTPPRPTRLARPARAQATVAWMDDEPLVAGRVYWALHGHRWVKAKVRRVVHKLDINTLAEEDASSSSPTPSAMWSCCCRSRCPLRRLPARACWAR
jgi:sulfate adenylyltransferase subunit 1